MKVIFLAMSLFQPEPPFLIVTLSIICARFYIAKPINENTWYFFSKDQFWMIGKPFLAFFEEFLL
jgi:hypothetical protein